VESLTGNVNAGTGNLSEILVNEVIVNPKTGAVTTPQQPIAGSGILATTLPNAPKSLAVGNITVETPQGDIEAGNGGIVNQVGVLRRCQQVLEGRRGDHRVRRC